MLNIASIVISVAITLGLGIAIISLGWSVGMTMGALVALLIAVALIKGRFGGPREFHVEKPAEGGPLRVTGRFSNGEIPAGKPREIARLEMADDRLIFETGPPDDRESFQIEVPAFSVESMTMLHDEIERLQESSLDGILDRFRSGVPGIKLYDAKQLVLLRYVQKPSYMAILWIVSGLTMAVLLLLVSFLSVPL
jgi:hypothetical protein